MLIQTEVIGSFMLPAFYYQFTDPKASKFSKSVFSNLNHLQRGMWNNFLAYLLLYLPEYFIVQRSLLIEYMIDRLMVCDFLNKNKTKPKVT